MVRAAQASNVYFFACASIVVLEPFIGPLGGWGRHRWSGTRDLDPEGPGCQFIEVERSCRCVFIYLAGGEEHKQVEFLINHSDSRQYLSPSAAISHREDTITSIACKRPLPQFGVPDSWRPSSALERAEDLEVPPQPTTN